MAAIDKLRTKFYHEREDLIIWCIEHKPSLLRNVLMPFSLSYDEWAKWQKRLTSKQMTKCHRCL